MSLAELFYTKHPRRSARLTGKKASRRRRRILFEPLEPRLLLSAEPLSLAAEAASDLTLRLVYEAEIPTLQIVDNTAAPESQVLASRALADTSAVEILGSEEDDRLTIDASAAGQVGVTFAGDGGADTLVGPGGADSTWTVTGPGAGVVGSVAFGGVEHLTGAADNEDTFVFEPGGSLGGVVAGGAGGFDSLVVTGAYETLVFTPTGPDSGSVDRDGDVITYAGLEPVAAGTAANVIFAGGLGADDWVLEDSPTAGQIQVRSTSGAIETTSFGIPTTLTINLGAGADTLLIQSLGDSGFSGSVTVNGGAGADTITVDAATTGSGTYTLNGGDLNDTVVLRAFSTLAAWVIDGGDGAGDTVVATGTGSQSLSLGDAALVVGAESIALGGIEEAALDGGTGATTITVSDWSGTARINGQGGNDIVKLGDGSGAATDDFGTVELTTDASEGADMIDFTGHTGALTVSTTGFANDTITSSDGSVLRQLGTLTEEIDATLPVGGLAAIEGFLDDLLAYVVKLQDSAEGLGQLVNQLPFVDGDADGSLGELTGLTAAITQFVTEAKAALGAQTTFQAVASALDGLPGPGAPFDGWSLGVATSYRGSHPGADDATGALELLLDVALDAEIDDQTFALELGEEGAALGVRIGGGIEVDASLDAAFAIGISTQAPLQVFLVPGGTLTLGVDAVADISGSTINLGFLGLHAGPGSTIGLDGQVELAFVDDGTKADERIDLAAVLLPGAPEIGDVTIVTVSDPDASDPFVETVATLDIAPGVLVGGDDLGDPLVVIDFAMGLSGPDPFGTQSEPATPSITTFEADLSALGGPAALDLLRFGNVSPTVVMGMLGGVLDTLVALAGSQFMQVAIPYTGKTVGDILDYGRSFKEDVLDPLFLSGDFLAPDADGDGAVSLPFFDNDGDGDVDATDAALAELRVGNIQELIAALAGNLGMPGLTARLDGGELSFTIDFVRAFGLGDGGVTTTTQGATGVTSEVQRLSHAITTVDAFRLAFRDAVGALQITSPIQVAGQTPATIAGAIEDALELFAAIGAGNVSVAHAGVIGGFRAFDITFASALGNVPQLGFAGELPLDFGTSLGDFLGFSTSGSFGMAGVLDMGLTFGIDLSPNTPVRVIPPVFAPTTVQATTATQGVAGVTDEVVTVRLVEAAGDAYELAFRATPETGTFTPIGPVTVDADASLLDDDLHAAFTVALGAANAPVVTAAPDDPRLLTVTFNAGTNALTDVELVGAREAGILSGAAGFDVSLFNQPAIGIGTATEGDNLPATNEVQKVHVLNATGGTFTLSFGGGETGPIAYGAPGGGAGSVQAALEALGTIGAGNVSVTKAGNVYTVTFQGGLAATDVAALRADARGLVNASALGVLAVGVARDTTNTSLADLAEDVQAGVDQALFDADLTVGFDPGVASSPGSHTTGLIANGNTFTAAAQPFGGGALPGDLPFTVVLPLAVSVTTTTQGVPSTTAEVQRIDIDAEGGTFTLSDGSVTTDVLAFNATAATVRQALEGIFGANTVEVTRTVSDVDSDGQDEVRYTVTFDAALGDVGQLIAAGERQLTGGQVRVARAESLGLAPAIQNAVNVRLLGTGVSIAVGTAAGGELTITPTGSDLELRFASTIRASAGGERITLDPPLARTSFSTLEPAVEVRRRLEITVDHDDPAFQEMAIASAPTRFDGRIVDDIAFTLEVNGTDVPVTLLAGGTGGNTSLDQLVGQLQTALDTALGAAGFAAGDVVVQRVAIDPDDPASLRGNRLAFEGRSGVVTTLAIVVPDSATNGAIAELGFAAGRSDTKRSKASAFFLEDVSFGGNIGLFENDVAATASLGLLAVTAEMTGTLPGAPGTFFGADARFDLVNPLDGSSRVTVDVLASAINTQRFVFQAGEAGGTPDAPATGFVDGVVSGGLGLSLALEPDGAIAGLPVALGSIDIAAQSPNWLIAPPSPANPFGFAKDAQSLALPGVTVDTAGASSSAGVLDEDMLFVLSQTFGGEPFATPVVVRADDTTGNGSDADLETDIQAAVDRAIARLQRRVDQAGLVETAGTVDVAVSGHAVTFTTASANTADAVDLRGLFVDVDFEAGTLQDLLDAFKDFRFGDLISALRLVVDMLRSLDGSDDGSPLADVFDFDLPVIDRSIGDLVDLSGDFLEFVDELAGDPSRSVQSLETRLRSLLGLPAGPPILSFDTTAKVFSLDVGFSSSAQTLRPFNLDLAEADAGIFSQLVGLSASGNLGVQAGIDFTLRLGLDLVGADKAFFIDVPGTSLGASASAFGDDLAFEASLGPVGVFVLGGSASLDGTFDVDFIDAGASTTDGRLILAEFGGSGLDDDLDALSDFLATSLAGTGEVVLPMFYGLESSPAPMGDPAQGRDFGILDPPSHFTGAASLAGNELGLFVDFLERFDGEGDGDDGSELRMPDFDLGGLSLPSLFTLLSEPGVILRGLNTVLEHVQDVLNGELFGVDLPLVGRALADNPAANFIEDFRLDFLQPLADRISESNLNLDGLIGLVEGVIDDVFDDALGILRTAAIHRFLDAHGGPANAADARALQFEFDLGDVIELTLDPIAFEVPIKALEVSAKFQPVITIAWNLHFGFGVDLHQGFYFVSAWDDPADPSPDGDDPELRVSVNLDLGDDAVLEATHSMLAVTLSDGIDLDGDTLVEDNPTSPSLFDEVTKLFIAASVDIHDTDGDGKLTLRELITQQVRETFEFDLAGGALLRFHTELNFGEADGGSRLSLSSVLPAISTELVINFEIGYNSLSGLRIEAPEVAFADVSLDLGDFIGSFAGDLLHTVSDILEPLAWLIGPEGLLNRRLPLISDLLGETVRVRDLVSFFDPNNAPRLNAFLDFAEKVYFLIDFLEDALDASVINFGDLVVAKHETDSFFDEPAFAALFDEPYLLTGPAGSDGDVRNAQNFDGFTIPDPGEADFGAESSETRTFLSGVTQPGSIDFPILKPREIFGLLLGRPATLFTVEFPELGFDFMYRQVIPIIGPLAGTFAGRIAATLDLGFGYDTLGISQFSATDNPAYLLNGFFLNDVDPATGADRNEASFGAEIAVGAALSLGVASVGVEGGIAADIVFNLNDPDQDTKVRFAELAANIAANDGDPLAMFDVGGVIEFFLRAYVQVLFFEKSFEFARLTLFDFDLEFDRPGVLASQQGSTLTLNIGPNAAGRLQGDTSDGAETIHAKTIADGTVVVWGFDVPEGLAETNPFTGVETIVVSGGAGADVIDLGGVLAAHGVAAEVHGDEGNDLIIGGGGGDELFGDDGDDVIYGGAGADAIEGGRGDDQLFGEDGDDELFGNRGDDRLDGGPGKDRLRGGLGNDEIVRSLDFDVIDLGDAGSIELIVGGAGAPALDLSDKDVPVTVFVKDDRILIGFGKQSVSTATLLDTAFAFTDLATLTAQFGTAFEHIVGVIDASSVSTIVGTSEADTFHVQETTTALTLDGGVEADRYFFYADPSGANPIDTTVDDVGENLKDENVLTVVGSSVADTITVRASDITLDAGATQVVAYVPPSSDPNDFTDQLIIKVFGNGGADWLTVESTFVTVPVQVDGGLGNDVVTVGDGTLNALASSLNANANDGFGFGPLVLMGGGGHDTVVFDDSGDGDNPDNVGNVSAFREKREGVPGLVEVGVVSGLGMTMTIPGVGEVDGHAELEGFEVVDVRMGTGADVLTVGGALNLDSGDPDGGTWDPLALTDTQVPKTRLFDPATLFGISENAHTISGMTIVRAGAGPDDVRILRTQDLAAQQDEPSAVVTAAEVQAGDRDATPSPLPERVRIDIRAEVGAFVLEFADRSLDDTDPSGDDTVPGAEQTVVLPYDLTASDLREALGALRLVGGTSFIDDVSATAGPLGAGVVRSYTVTFSPQLDNLPDLHAFDAKLLVAGEGGDDAISLQSIDQPTWVLGGSALGADTPADDDDQDTLNVNVQIGINGPELASAPDGLDAIPPAKAVANGVNAELTVDGGPEGDTYWVYLFGGDADSQINLFDSGVTTDDAAIVFGTEQPDMFLLRAAVADDGLAFVAMIKPPGVPVLDTPDTHVERVNYRGSLDSMKLFALEGDDTFGIDDTRLDFEIYGGEGEDFFQVGQLYKSQRNAAAGVPFADVFATIETTRGFLSNGIGSPMKIFGGDDNDEFVVYHNLAPLALFGNDGDDSFLIRAFALVGSQEDLRERTDVSGDAGADLIQYAVNAPVNIDGGDGFDTIIVIGTEFNDDFVITEGGIFGAGLNIQFVRVETVEVDGDAGDDRFFVLGTRAGVLTRITGGLGSDTFFANGPTPDVVSNDLLGHSGLISHSVDSSLPPAESEFAGIKVVGIAANVADDDEPAVRLTISDGASIVSQVHPLATDHYTVVLTRKPEHGTRVVVTSRAPAGVKFTAASDGVLGADEDSVAFTFDDGNWNVPQTGVFTAFQDGRAEIQVGNDGGNGENARQTLALNATEGSFKLTSADGDLGGPWTTSLISFDVRGDGKTLDGPDADLLDREDELDQLRDAIAAALNAVSSKAVTVARVRTTFFLEFADTAAIAGTVAALGLDAVTLTFNDIVGTDEGFITHDVTLEVGAPEDSIRNLFAQGTVPAQRDGAVDVRVDTEGGGGTNEIQLVTFDASDGTFTLRLGDQVSEEMLFIPLDPGRVRDAIDHALNAFAGIDAVVTKIGAASDYGYRVEFVGASAGVDVATLQVEAKNLVKGERILTIVGGLPQFVVDPDGDGSVLEPQEQNLLRGATVKVVAGAGIGQTRLVIANTANSITVSNPWSEALDETSRIEILRYEGVVLPATLVQIVGDDGPAIDLRETGGETVAFEAPEVHGFGGGPTAGATDSDGLGLVETVTVALTSPPSADVTVALGSDDAFGNQQLFFAVEGPAGTFTVVESLTFTAGTWDQARTVHVFGVDDALTEGFHKAVLTLTASGGGYADVVNSVVVDVADSEVALAMVLESARSTDVVETGNFFNGGVAPTDDVDGDNAASDRYRIVLSRAPQAGETVTVNLSADPTRTQRGAGRLGIRAFDPEVALSSASLAFDETDWFLPQTVTVTAAADDKVEGDDSKSFATRFDLANSLEGPLVVTGGLSEDRTADLEREPIVLPGETNFKPSIGTVRAVPDGVDGSFSLTIDLDEVIPGRTVLDTRLQGGTQGILTVTTNANGDPGLLIQEVQLLSVDAVSGTFRLTLDGATFTGDITYDPAAPATVATDIENGLNLLGGPSVAVEAAGTAFIITFADTTNHAPIRFADGANTLGENDLVRVGTAVDATSSAEQILTVSGNGGSFRLSLDGGLTKTAAIGFTPDDPAVNQAQVIEAALAGLANLGTVLGAGASVGVSGSGTTYIVTFLGAVNPIPALTVHDAALRVDEVQALTLNASLGQFKLTLDGTTGNTTAFLPANVTAGALEAALEGLDDLSDVTVRKDAEQPVYTIIVTGPGGADVDQLRVVDSTLERTVREALETTLGIAITTPEDLRGFTAEITRGAAKNKVRLVIGGSDPDASPAAGLTTLEISRPWEGGLIGEVPSLAGGSEYTIERTNPNLLVDENEETDFFFLDDTDNVTSIQELPAAELVVTADHLSGLGMGGDQLIGGRLLVTGGIQYTGLEELIITLGPGDNRVVIEDTQPGATTINAGAGADEFVVHRLSGHTFLHAGAGADTVHVSDGSYRSSIRLLSGINALLTVTGDVPRAVALTLGKGAAPDPVALIGGVDEIQQITVEATGGQFQAGFVVDGARYFTSLLDHDVSDTGLRDALQDVVEAAFGVDDTAADVLVTRGGNVYRITFTDQMGEQDVPLLAINDLGLTAETGAAPGDVLTIDNSADTAGTQAVLTQTSLTGLGMGDLGTPGTTFNEIQTLRVDATGGTLTLGIDGTALGSAPLTYDIAAADLDAVLEAMLFEYLNGLLTAAGQEALEPADVAGGLVEVARNDDVSVIRFVGLLSNRDVAQLTVDGAGLTRDDELPGGAVVTVQGLAETATRLDGITAQNQNEIQTLTLTATGGTFTLAFPNTDAENVTAPLPFDVTRAALQLALEALPAIVPGDVVLTEVGPGEFDIEFTGELSSADLAELIVDSAGLTGGTAAVATLQTGRDTGLNDVQVLTVAATAGTYRLELFLPAVQKTLVTEALAFDASSEHVRRALQHALARTLNGLNDDADLSRTREAFKADFSVARVGNTYLIGFQGVTRQLDGGQGASLLRVLGDPAFDAAGGAAVLTRMDGINYYGFEQVNIHLGSGADVLNVQGTSAGSFTGVNAPLDDVHAATNITLAAGDDQVFVSSSADLDYATIFTTAGAADVFEFLTGDLDAIGGNLNLDLGAGRHRLLISDEGTTAGDPDVAITDVPGVPRGAGGFDATGAAELQLQGLAFGDITYGVDPSGDLFDGVIYWTGSGDDTIGIDGTHVRAGERTTTLLNTGLGDDHVTVDLDTGEDGFFVLNTMGGAAAHTPVDPGLAASDDDTVRAAGSTLPLIVFGGLGDDDLVTGQNEDVVFGDFGRVQYLDGLGTVIAVLGFGGRDDMLSSQIVDPTWVISRDLNLGGVDILEGQGDDDVLIGGPGGHSIGDYLDGDSGDDLIFGDIVRLFRRDTTVDSLGAITDPRFQALLGQVIYSRRDVSAAAQGIPTLPPADETGEALVDGVARDFRNQDGSPAAAWNEYAIVELYHSQAIADGLVAGLQTSFGDDYIAGGAEHDAVFGQLGDDVIQGDGAIACAVGPETAVVNRVTHPPQGLVPVGAARVPDPLNPAIDLTATVTVARTTLVLAASFEAATDGDDYIEGNGGADVIFGDLGQDDIVGDSSSLFTLDSRDERLPHGADLIFGGAGTNVHRNDLGDAALGQNDVIVADPTGHARDADVIAGDNANIYRLVGLNGVDGSGDTDGDGFLEFTYDLTSTYENRGALRIIPRAVELLDYTPGGADFDAAALDDIGAADEAHGEAGDDVIYGMAGPDVLFGDAQDDDLLGGYGHDWVSGGTGQDGIIGDDGRLVTSRNGTTESLNGVLTATAQASISTPGNVQQATIHVTGQLKKAADLTPFSQEPGWMAMDDEWAGESTHTSDDIIYGGLGSDVLHGGSGDDAMSGAEALPEFFSSPANPGDVLQYGLAKAGEFASYNEYDALRRIEVFLLNFDQTEGVLRPGGTVPKATGQQNPAYGEVRDDGDDKLFGDLGNDWLVGGTGRDDLFGGWGDDLLNADDDHDSTAQTGDPTANNVPDTHPTYEDRAYGGAGRDILIGNTGGDRLIDWVGEFNSYLVPFAPFGLGTVSRALQPQISEFLYALSAADGADPSRAVDTGADAARNGEPFGELGLVRQQDFAWQDQTGAPADPQAGNIPGGARDVLRSANFNDGSTSGFFADSGVWAATGGVLQVQAESKGGDAVSVFHVGDPLPGYFEITASVLAVKPTSGWKANSYLIFDYQGKQDFKFAGLDVSTNKLVMGHRDATGWHVDQQAAVKGGVKADKLYNLLLAVNSVTVTLVVDGKNVFTHVYQPRVIDGVSYGLNWGLVGVGSDNSRGQFDNIVVQGLPPQITLTHTETFDDGVANLFGGEQGAWQVQVANGNGRYVGAPAAGGTGAFSLIDLGLANGLETASYLELTTRVSTRAAGGVVFDQYGPEDFKFVAVDAASGNVVIGHRTANGGWVVDAAVAKAVTAGTNYDLTVGLRGTTVSVSLNGQVVLGYVFNAVVVDGSFGLVTRSAGSSFDSATIKTDDPAFMNTPSSLTAAAPAAAPADGASLSEATLATVAAEATRQWSTTLGGDARALAALDDMRFGVADLPGLTLGQTHGSTVMVDADAAGHGWTGDALLTTVLHEVGHVLGRSHDADDALMAPTLAVRTQPAAAGNALETLAPTWAAVAAAPGLARGVEAPSEARAVTGLTPAPGENASVGLVDWTASPHTQRGWNVRTLQSPRRWDWDVVDLAVGDGAPDANADLFVELG